MRAVEDVGPDGNYPEGRKMNCIILSFFVFRAVFVGFSIVLSLLRRLREREGSLRGVEQTSRAASGQNFCAAAKKAAKEAYIAADLPGFAPKLPILPVFQRRNAVAATTKRLMVFSLLCRFTAFFHCSIFSIRFHLHTSIDNRDAAYICP